MYTKSVMAALVLATVVGVALAAPADKWSKRNHKADTPEEIVIKDGELMLKEHIQTSEFLFNNNKAVTSTSEAPPKPNSDENDNGEKPENDNGEKLENVNGGKPENDHGETPKNDHGGKPKNDNDEKPGNGYGGKPKYINASKHENDNRENPDNDNGGKPGNGHGGKPKNGNGSKPENDNGEKPGNGNGGKPGNGNGGKPGNGNGGKPGNGNGGKPGNGNGGKPGNGNGGAQLHHHQERPMNGFLDRIFAIPINILQSVNMLLNQKHQYMIHQVSTGEGTEASGQGKPGAQMIPTQSIYDGIFNIPITILKSVVSLLKWLAN